MRLSITSRRDSATTSGGISLFRSSLINARSISLSLLSSDVLEVSDILEAWIDDDRAGRLAGGIIDRLAQERRIDVGQPHGGNRERLAVDRRIERRILPSRGGIECRRRPRGLGRRRRGWGRRRAPGRLRLRVGRRLGRPLLPPRPGRPWRRRSRPRPPARPRPGVLRAIVLRPRGRREQYEHDGEGKTATVHHWQTY